MHVLDAGCGSGEFTCEVAQRASRVSAFDFAEKMIEAAEPNARKAGVENARFLLSHTDELPFATDSFDLVYSRRGPTSILLHPEVLRPGGLMIGQHSERIEVVRERLAASGLIRTSIKEFEALEVFPSVEDFAAFWSRMPGHPDYLAAENATALADLVSRYDDGQSLRVAERRFVWQGKRPG